MKKKTLDEFITQARKIHNNKYNYDEVVHIWFAGIILSL